jgi:hypothetical protein
MAVDFYLDPLTGDIDLNNNNLMRLTSNIEESSRQQVLISLSTFKGEIFWDINAGIPYLRNDNNDVQALGERSKAFLDALIQNDVLGREHIISLTTYSSSMDKTSGKLTVVFSATTSQGAVVPITVTV